MSLLELKEISYSYGKGKKVLENISLRLGTEDFLAVVGANGSGKTTLAKILVGMLKIHQGSYLIKGEDSQKLSLGQIGQKIGFVQQNPSKQFFTSKVEKEIAFGLVNRGKSPEQVQDEVDKVLSCFNLEKQRNSHPLSLSQGEKKRLAVACMAVLKPQFLILDEPTAGLDRKNKENMLAYLQKLNREDGMGIAIVTHDLELISSYASKLLVLEQGRILYQGEVKAAFLRQEIWQQLKFPLPASIQLACQLHSDFQLPLELEIKNLAKELQGVLSYAKT